MFIQINAQNGVPVYDQIARQVKFAVADGVLTPGELIPSVRELARELAINPNTVARAYRELQQDEVVELVPGTGLGVRSGARRLCQAQRRELIRQQIQQTLRESLEAGFSFKEVRAIADAEMNRLRKTFRRAGEKP